MTWVILAIAAWLAFNLALAPPVSRFVKSRLAPSLPIRYEQAMVTQLPRDRRMTKDQAQYVEYSTQTREDCANCSMYGVGNCHLVEGSINPQGWCSYWRLANGKHS